MGIECSKCGKGQIQKVLNPETKKFEWKCSNEKCGDDDE